MAGGAWRRIVARVSPGSEVLARWMGRRNGARPNVLRDGELRRAWPQQLSRLQRSETAQMWSPPLPTLSPSRRFSTLHHRSRSLQVSSAAGTSRAWRDTRLYGSSPAARPPPSSPPEEESIPPAPLRTTVPLLRQLKLWYSLTRLRRPWPPPFFTMEEFLEGVKYAFCRVHEALSRGDISAIRPALGDALGRAMEDTVREYQAQGVLVESQVEEIRDVQIVDMRPRIEWMRGIDLDIEVEYVVRLSTTWRNPEGKVLNQERHVWHKPVWRFRSTVFDVNPPEGANLVTTARFRSDPPLQPDWQLVDIAK